MSFHFSFENLIRGSKGGGKGKGGSSGSDASNTLRSKARARIIEAISEGPCVGLVNWDKSVYYEETPITNPDGTVNFKNVILQQRLGTPDQEHLTGFATAEIPYDVNVKVGYNTGPVQRTVIEPNATAIRAVVNIPSLASQNKKSGAIETASVSYAFEVRGYNGGWQRVVTENLVNQKTTSAVQRAHRIDLPDGGAPWDVRMVRLTPDSDNERLQNDTTWEGYAVLIEGKFIYPHTALVATEVNAEDMGNSIPARKYRFRGRIISVPSNYDPIGRIYAGIWDGTFKQAWTNNPAWIFYDILINDRYGLGEFINPETVDKWTLYQIAQYCDQMVKSGFKNADTGQDIYEPRFTFNGVLQSRQEAYKALQQITTTWRGMCYWSLGQVFATADMPADPVKLVTPANVIGGEFNYSGTAKKARSSVVLVKFNNKDNFYQPEPEPVTSDTALARFGWREKTVDLLGATTRGEAHRYGKWIIDTEENETETVEYTASWDHADVRPGDLIAVADPRKAQMRLGGRLASAGTDYVTLDQPFERAEGELYSLMIAMPDGTLHKAPVDTWADEVLDGDGNSLGFLRANLGEVLPQQPDVNTMWLGTGTDIQPRQYRVIAMSEEKKNQFKITALFHDPNKFARVEEGISLEPITYTRPKGQVAPPTGLKVREVSYVNNGRQYARLTLSWEVLNDYTVREYEVGALHPTKGYIKLGTTENSYMDLDDAEIGQYTFYVYAIGYSTQRSAPATFDYEYVGFNGLAAPSVTELKLVDNPNGTEFTGRDVMIFWKNNFPSSTSILADDASPTDEQSPFYAGNTIKVYHADNGQLLRQQLVTGSGFTYSYEMNKNDSTVAGLAHPTRKLRFEVTVSATYNRTSAQATLTVNNPVPGLVTLRAYADGKNILLNWDNPAESDFAGVKVWVEENNTFDPDATVPFYIGRNDAVIYPAKEVTIYHVRIGAFDTFDQDMLISAPLQVQTGRILDSTPPVVPTGLALESAMDVGPDGTLRAVVKATINANTEDDLGGYQFQIKEDDGNYITFPSSEPDYEWTVTPGRTYTVHVRATDRYNNPSDYCAPVSIAAAVDDVAPSTPQNVGAVGLFRSNWVDWDLVPDADTSFYEVETTKSGLTTIMSCAAPAFIHSNLVVGEEWMYRVRAVDTSGNRSDWSEVAIATVGAINPGDLPPDAIISSFALIDEAFIESAHIVEIDAAKIKAGTVIAGNVIVATSGGNIPLADIGAAGDPADTINHGATQIEPGKIKIASGVTLADWRYGPDQTTINGGSIAANTIAANSLSIGMRGISTDGLIFEHNKPAINNVSWTAGTVRYIGDDGNVATRAISAGSAVWSGGYMYLIWIKGANALTATTDGAVAFGSNAVILSIYAGGKDLTTNYGRTVIDGDQIKTGSIQASAISVTSLSSLTANIGTLTAGKMQSTDGLMVVDLDLKRILIADLT
jgi:predicted phage tail protein